MPPRIPLTILLKELGINWPKLRTVAHHDFVGRQGNERTGTFGKIWNNNPEAAFPNRRAEDRDDFLRCIDVTPSCMEHEVDVGIPWNVMKHFDNPHNVVPCDGCDTASNIAKKTSTRRFLDLFNLCLTHVSLCVHCLVHGRFDRANRWRRTRSSRDLFLSLFVWFIVFRHGDVPPSH